MREERKKPDSEYGKLINEHITNGSIVPVEITLNLLKIKMDSYVAKGSNNFLIDGFPRNKDNLEGWNKIMGDCANVQFCLFFDCPEEVMEGRLLERGKTSGRADDNIESIKKRFKTYVESTQPIIEAYDTVGRMKRVVSDKPVEDVFSEVSTLFA